MDTKLQTILVGVDGSTHSEAAVDFAANLCQRMDASLIILYVRDPRTTEQDVAESYGTRATVSASERARKRGAQRIETVMEAGDPAKCIVDVAGARNADLIVLGRRGLGTLTELLLGSVSHELVQISKCSVVIVP